MSFLDELGVVEEPHEPDWKSEAERLGTELEELRISSAHELELATAVARDETLRTANTRFAQKEIARQAGERGVDSETLLSAIDVTRFFTDDGDEVDTDAITKWLDAVAPKQPPRRVIDFGGGARGSSLPPSPGAVFGEVLRRELHG